MKNKAREKKHFQFFNCNKYQGDKLKKKKKIITDI